MEGRRQARAGVGMVGASRGVWDAHDPPERRTNAIMPIPQALWGCYDLRPRAQDNCLVEMG